MTLIAVNAWRAAIVLHRPTLTPEPRKDGCSFWHVTKGGLRRRAIRLSKTGTTGVVELLRAASSRGKDNPKDLQRFDGPLENLLAIIDEEVARIEEQEPVGTSRAKSRKSEKSAHTLADILRNRLDLPIAVVPSGTLPPELTPEIVNNDVSLDQHLLYRWQIFGQNGSLLGVYVGKAGATKPETPRKRVDRYRRRVSNLLQGKPYANNCAHYRTVHYALAHALQNQHRVVLTYLCNAKDAAMLSQLEHQLIAEHASFGPLPHQLNDEP